ncbi:cyclic peptide export ABC transporter [Pseudanabaena sp. FACHB-2040]|nr:cyclic peptide export ABC transporter [Pseudanabaena sp. FACHB-2040]
MNLIGFLLRNSWRVMVMAGLTGIISGGTSVLLLALINQTLGSDQVAGSLVLWSFIGLAAVTLLSSLTSQILLATLSESSVFRLRLQLSRQILAVPLRQLEALGANRLLATLTEDTLTIGNAAFNLPFICVDLALVLGCLAYLAWLSVPVLAGTLVFLIAAIALVQWLINQTLRVFKQAREQQDFLFKHFQAITAGLKELKLHRERRQVFFTEELQSTAEKLRDYRVAGLRLSAIASSGGEILLFTLLGLLVFGLPNWVEMTPTVLSGYVLTLVYLTRPLQSLLQSLPGLGQASVSLQKVDALGLSLAEHAETNEQLQFSSTFTPTQIDLVQLTYTYPNDTDGSHFTLGPIDLTIKAGEVVFIVGGNGSGKSTLAKLLVGLYSPDEGKICVNDMPITDQNREAYRQLFATVFADFFLFEKLLGLNLADLDAQAKTYLERLQLGHKVQVTEGMLSTLNLSQGQRKRLALLTAYLEDRPIYLFDEWASDQDPYFREIFYHQILPELKQQGKTVLVISHDDRYFSIADRLLKLEYGSVVGEG